MPDPNPGGVVDRIDDRNVRRGEWELAHAGRPKGTIFPLGLHVEDFDIVRDIPRVRHTLRHENRELLQVFKILAHGETDALSHSAAHLAVDREFVIDLSSVSHLGVVVHLSLAGSRVHRYFSHEHPVHVDWERAAPRVLIEWAAHGLAHLASYREGDAFSFHLVVRTVRAVMAPFQRRTGNQRGPMT
jgi:hypothetical protein